MPCGLRGKLRRIGLTDRRRQVEREQSALIHVGLAARRAQLVDQRQQHHRHIAVAALQPLDVVRQLDHAPHQRGAGGVALGDLAFLQGVRDALHLLGDQRGRAQLDHAQRAEHLVQVRRAGPHGGSVGRILGKDLDLHARLAQGFVDLRLDPAQRGGVDGVAHRGHACAPRRAVCRALHARDVSRLVACKDLVSAFTSFVSPPTSALTDLQRQGRD